MLDTQTIINNTVFRDHRKGVIAFDPVTRFWQFYPSRADRPLGMWVVGFSELTELVTGNHKGFEVAAD